MNDAQLEAKLAWKIAFAARAYMTQTTNPSLTEQDSLELAKKNVVLEHIAGKPLESMGQLMSEPSVEQTVELLYRFQKEAAYERNLLEQGVKLGIFEKGTNIMNFTRGHAEGYRQGLVRVETRMDLTMVKGAPNIRFAKTLAELKRKIGEAEYAVELQVQNGILPLNSTIDTVTEAEKKEALRQKGLENKRYSYGSEY